MPRTWLYGLTGILMVVSGASWACNAGDPLVTVIRPFDLYENYFAVENRIAPIGHLDRGEVCIDNSSNRGAAPPQNWTWVYFKNGLRDFEGVAPLSAFQSIETPADAAPTIDLLCSQWADQLRFHGEQRARFREACIAPPNESVGTSMKFFLVYITTAMMNGPANIGPTPNAPRFELYAACEKERAKYVLFH